MMAWWQRYWFRPAPLLDLAVVRIAAVALQLVMLATATSPEVLRTYADLPQDLFQPLEMYRILTWPLGSPYFPSFARRRRRLRCRRHALRPRRRLSPRPKRPRVWLRSKSDGP
jgi:hypothetical protein